MATIKKSSRSISSKRPTMKKAQPGALVRTMGKSLLGEYMGGAAENQLQRKLANIAQEKAVKEAAFEKSYVPLPKKRGKSSAEYEQERVHKEDARKAFGLNRYKDNSGYGPKPSISSGFSDVRKSMSETMKNPKAKTEYSIKDLSKKEQIRKDYEGLKKGGTVKKAKVGATVSKTAKAKDGKWIQKAVNPKHKGYCTPMTKATCTPKRKALAKTFKAMGRARKGK